MNSTVNEEQEKKEFLFFITSKGRPEDIIHILSFDEESFEIANTLAEDELHEFRENYPHANVELRFEAECPLKQPDNLENSKDNNGFAFFPNFLTVSCKDLAAMVEEEDWGHNFGSVRDENPFLTNYIKYTYKRLAEENKIEISKDGSFSCFNTGLVTKYQEAVYAFFKKNRRKDTASWVFDGWFEHGNRRLSVFPKLPERARYFEDPSCLFFDVRKKILINTTHVIEDNINRFPENFRNEKSQFLLSVIKGQLETVKEKICCDYKIAIPCYYAKKVQLLLPLYLTNQNKPDMALAIEDHGEHYRVATCLTLEMAYCDARLISKQDRAWLNP
jgi:hypothetical protein